VLLLVLLVLLLFGFPLVGLLEGLDELDGELACINDRRTVCVPREMRMKLCMVVFCIYFLPLY